VTTVAGLSPLAGNANGVGTNARLFFPAGLALDAGGFLYVADMANNTARTTRILSPTLQFTTVAGQLILSWPLSAEGFALEQSAEVSASATWSPATNAIVSIGDNFVRTNSLNGTAYYRLRFP
jgi:hypothetical protein